MDGGLRGGRGWAPPPPARTPVSDGEVAAERCLVSELVHVQPLAPEVPLQEVVVTGSGGGGDPKATVVRCGCWPGSRREEEGRRALQAAEPGVDHKLALGQSYDKDHVREGCFDGRCPVPSHTRQDRLHVETECTEALGKKCVLLKAVAASTLHNKLLKDGRRGHVDLLSEDDVEVLKGDALQVCLMNAGKRREVGSESVPGQPNPPEVGVQIHYASGG